MTSSASSVDMHSRILSTVWMSAPAIAALEARISILASAFLEWVFMIPAASFTALPRFETRTTSVPSSQAWSSISPTKLLHFTAKSESIPGMLSLKSFPNRSRGCCR